MYLQPFSVRQNEVRASVQPAAHAQVQLSLPPPRVKNSLAAAQRDGVNMEQNGN